MLFNDPESPAMISEAIWSTGPDACEVINIRTKQGNWLYLRRINNIYGNEFNRVIMAVGNTHFNQQTVCGLRWLTMKYPSKHYSPNQSNFSKVNHQHNSQLQIKRFSISTSPSRRSASCSLDAALRCGRVHLIQCINYVVGDVRSLQPVWFQTRGEAAVRPSTLALLHVHADGE